MGFSLGNTLGLIGLLSIIPLIILYLIKPKPSNLKVPSLMFFFSNTKSTTLESFLRHFHQDILFYLQLLALLLLGLSLAQPLLTYEKNAVSNNLVFVLDVSASSKVLEDGKYRIDIAKDSIKELSTSKNSLVLVKSKPVLALQNVGRSELVRYLDTIQPTDDLSDISSAIILGAELINNKGRIVVVSDLISSKGVPIDVAENLANAKDIHVDFINTAKKVRNNIGIIDLALTPDSANVYIKNYNNKDETVKLIMGNEIKELNVKSGNVEPIVFELQNGDMEIKLDVKDDFEADNKIIITKPYKDKIKVLLVGNPPSRFLKAALNSIQEVELHIAQLPVIPKDDFDIILINNIKENDLLEGSFEELKTKVTNDESDVIIASWDGIENLDFKGLLPVNFNKKNTGGIIQIDQITRFTKDIDFGEIKTYYDININDGVSLASYNGSSVISSFHLGNGEVIYYGIMDDSDFKLNPSFPVFWNNLIFHLADRLDLNEINLRTGSVLDISNTTSLNLDRAGIFNVADRKISVNLLNEKESNINLDKKETANKKFLNKAQLDPVRVNVDYKLERLLIFIVLLLVIAEFAYIKIRGEI